MQIHATLRVMSLLVLGLCVLSAMELKQGNFANAIGMQLKTDTATTETLDELSALGARWVRRGVYWHGVEKESGVYDFAEYDKLFGHAEKNGLRVLATLFGNNKLHEDDKHGGIQSEAGRKGMAAFAAACAKRYKGKDIIWEVWNEPNVRTFWRKNGKHNSPEFADEYTKLVKEIAAAMLKEDPNVFIMAGSVSCFWEPSFNWTDACFSKGMGSSGIKAWSVHPYGLKSPEMFTAGYDRMKSILKKYGAEDLVILNSERGFASKKKKEGWSGGSEELGLKFQSWHIVRQYMIDQMNGVPLTIWYEWGSKDFGFGVKGSERPGYAAFKVMAEQLGDYSYDSRIELENPQDYVLVFKKGSATKLVIWTAPKDRETPDKAIAHTVSIPLAAKGAVAACALDGSDVAVAYKDGAISIKIEPAAQYIWFE